MEEKDDIKRVLKLLSEKLKVPENKELMEGFVKELLPFCSTGESRLDEIYELCIEKIIQEQATAFYKDFPIDEIRTRLIEDFIRINKLLFPKGQEHLEIYDWSVEWSNFFDDGLEWWGAAAISIYDKLLDRYIIIFASATD